MYVVEGINCRLGFICHPKTGSQSVRVAMGELGATSLVGHHRIDVDVACDIVGEGGITTCVIRNPYDMMVSWYFYSHYNHPKADKLTFTEWLGRVFTEREHRQFTSVNRWWKYGLFYGASFCNRIIRYEAGLQEEFSKILFDCGLPECKLVVRGKSNDLESYRQMYGVDSYDLVTKAFQRELTEFGYSF